MSSFQARIKLNIVGGRFNDILKSPHRFILTTNTNNYTCEFAWSAREPFRLGEQRDVIITLLSEAAVNAVLDEGIFKLRELNDIGIGEVITLPSASSLIK
jgi:hypothetical protein